jgi:hypothetical protein
MALNKKILAVAAAGALTAAAAVPAMAFENEFHGMFQAQFDVSNFNGTKNLRDNQGDFGGFGTYTPNPADKKAPTANFVEQRARLAYIAKASDNLKLVTKFEIDSQFWGNNSYTVKRNGGAAIGADGINFETKSAYLDMSFPSVNINTKIGIQPFDDAFKGIFASSDMAGILLTHSYTNAVTSAGFYRWNDNGFDLGKKTRDFFVLDGKYNVTKDIKVGGAYYLVNSDNADRDQGAYSAPQVNNVEDVLVHMLGVNAEAAMGNLTLDGFLAYQFGNDEKTASKANSNHISAFAANVGAKLKVGKGTVRSEFLYVSGESNPGGRSTSNAFYTPSGFGLAESGFYNNEMVVLGRDKFAMTNDGAIVYDANNRDQGVIFGSIGYDRSFTDKLSGSMNLGFAAVAKQNNNKPVVFATGKPNGSNYLGTEINAEVGYKAFENVTVTGRAGYVVLGDYFKDIAANGTPDNPYDVKLIVAYSF